MGRKIRQEVETHFTSKDDVSSSAQQIGGNLKALALKFGPLAAAIGLAVGAAAAFKAALDKTVAIIRVSVQAVADQAVSLKQLSDSLDLSTQAMQGFSFAGQKVGVDSRDLGLAIQRMTRRIGEAAKGGGEAKKEMEALGLPIEALAKLKPEEQFFAIADALEHVGGQSAKLATAFKFFDSEGARPVLAVLAEGSDALKEQFRRAEELGGVFSDDLVRSGIAFKKSQVEMKTAVGGLGDEIATVFLPIATDAVQTLADFVSENRATIREAAEGMGRHITAALDGIKTFLDDHGAEFLQLLGAWAEIAGTVTELTLKVVTETAESIAETVSWWDALTKSLGALGGAAANLAAGPGVEVDISGVPDEVRDGALAARLAEVTEELEKARALLAEPMPVAGTVGAPVGFERPLPMPELEVGMPTLPEPGKIDDLQSRFGSLKDAVRDFGIEAVASTLEVDAAIQQIGKRAQGVFVGEFSRALQGMARAISITLVKTWGDMKSWKERANAIWRSFTDEVIAMLIRLIAKLLIAAGLQAILGFANFKAVAQLGQVLGLLKAPAEGAMFGGLTDTVARRGGGSRLGDAFALPVQAGEAILTRPTVRRLGRDSIASLNAGAQPLPAPGPEAILGGRTVVVIQNHVRTILGSREEGMALARGVLDYAEEQGFLGVA